MLKASIWVTILSLLGSALGLANQLLMAFRFGASRAVDSYLIALSIPTFVGGLLSAMVSYSVVPRLVSSLADRDRHVAYARAMLIVMSATGVVLMLAGWVCTPVLVRIGGRGYSDSLTIAMARVAWAGAALQIVVSYLSAISTAKSRFVTPVVAGLAPYAGMLALNYWSGVRHGIVVLPWGLAAGTFIGALILLCQVRDSLLVEVRKPLPWREVRTFLASSPWTAIAMTIFSIFMVVDAHLAPQLGEANLAYLGYSQRVIIALGTLTVAGPSAVLVPHLARAIAEGRISDFVHDTFRALAVVAGTATMAALTFQILGGRLVPFVFQRGAFDAVDSAKLAGVLSVMVLGMIPMVTVVILFRALFCLGNTRPPALGAIIWALAYYGSGSLLAPRFHAMGMALAYLASWALVLVLGLVWFKRATRPLREHGGALSP